MRIYIFSVFNEDTQLRAITTVYAKGLIRAFMALQVITGANDCDIEYIKEKTSAKPIDWVDN